MPGSMSSSLMSQSIGFSNLPSTIFSMTSMIRMTNAGDLTKRFKINSFLSQYISSYFITELNNLKYYITKMAFMVKNERWFFMNNSLVCIDVYTVTAGDTLYTIADKYDLPVSLLMKVDCITNPYNLEIGTRLCIPGDESQLTKPEEKPMPSMKVHVVEAGDTLYLIAKKHGVKLDDVMNANPNIDPYNLMIGTELYIPL